MHTLGNIEHKLKTGAPTRRKFIAALSALGLTAAACPDILGGNALAADTPQKDGRFRTGLAGGSTTDVLDPAQITDTGTRLLM